MPSETTLVKQLMMSASKLGNRLFRNNVGVGWAGTSIFKARLSGMVQMNAGDVLVRQARPLHAGLCKGSSDLIGWTKVVITSDMVGQTLAIFTAPEVKTARGRAKREQVAFMAAVNAHGGIAGIVRSEDDLIALFGSLESRSKLK